ncbi:MAG: hypothetical protein C4519_23540 [Desulfobacteraceae bacterium]|nr:MAG: hypothetical protein C4519_23540 [Desulfobacteraceae bacterium]
MIIREGENCWLKTRAERISFLVDAADYFEAFVRAVQQARQTIYIAGWDFDSRLVLNRRGKLPHDIPPLGKFLSQTARGNPGLQIYVLSWDFPLIYWREREWWPVVQFGWKTHRRIHFYLDDQHPMGGAQHQKFVVIDDNLAFCGGVDLTNSRWDTAAHHPEDGRRKNSSSAHYEPFHDIQMAVSGGTARVLGGLFRSRWRGATGKEVPAPREDRPRARWPASLSADIGESAVAVARTLPAYKGQQAVREVERLYLDAIESAERWIYIENQYLTAEKICQQLSRRLAQPNGPEVVIIMPSKASGWLEQSTMDAIRRHNLNLLFQQDRHRRLAVFWPSVGPEAVPVYVHSKILIADDRLAIVGSANLSNRSMGFDSECCLAVEGPPASRTAAALDRFRHRLLAEHLGRSMEEVAAACASENSLIRVIHHLGSPERCLKPLDMDVAPVVDGTAWVPDPSFLDPEEPFEFDLVMDRFARDSKPRARTVQLIKISAMLFVLLAIGAIWRWTPLAGWLTIERLAQWAGLLENTPLLMVMVIGAYVLGGLIFVPVTLLIGATALILPAWQSFVCAISGCVLNAWATYWVGRGLGKRAVRRLSGKRLNRLNKYLARRGILAIMMVRNLPIAPFTVVNIVAGTTRIKQIHFLLGTALGMLPGILVITVFTGQVLEVFKNPRWPNFLVVGAVAALVATGLWWMRKRVHDKNSVTP